MISVLIELMIYLLNTISKHGYFISKTQAKDQPGYV